MLAHNVNIQNIADAIASSRTPAWLSSRTRFGIRPYWSRCWVSSPWRSWL